VRRLAPDGSPQAFFRLILTGGGNRLTLTGRLEGGDIRLAWANLAA
jgi:hypothetical protein